MIIVFVWNYCFSLCTAKSLSWNGGGDSFLPLSPSSLPNTSQNPISVLGTFICFLLQRKGWLKEPNKTPWTKPVHREQTQSRYHDNHIMGVTALPADKSHWSKTAYKRRQPFLEKDKPLHDFMMFTQSVSWQDQHVGLLLVMESPLYSIFPWQKSSVVFGHWAAMLRQRTRAEPIYLFLLLFQLAPVLGYLLPPTNH